MEIFLTLVPLCPEDRQFHRPARQACLKIARDGRQCCSAA